MTHRTLIASGIVAIAGLGMAGAGMAAPVIDSVEVNRTGATTLEVDVDTERGTDAARPRITVSSRLVRVNRSGKARRANVRARARVDLDDWREATQAGDPVTATARLTRVRQATGKTIRVRVRACDSDGCITVNRRVTVLDDDSRDSTGRGSPGTRSSDSPTDPLPPGAIDADGAVRVALAAVGSGSALVSVEREDDYGAAWEVKVRRTDGARVKVYVSAGGAVVRTRVDDGDDYRSPLPPDSIGAEQAVAVALARVGDGSSLIKVEREDDRGVAWEVEVRAANGAEWEVYVSATGRVVKAEIDD